MRIHFLKTTPVATILIIAMAIIALSANVASAQDDISTDRIRSYEYRRDYVYLPIRQDPQLGDIPPIPDERKAIALNEFGDRVIEPMPNKVRSRMDLHRLWSRKLARGTSNLFLCWMEIPYQVVNSIEESDPATGLLVGGITGAFFTVTRACVGAYEIVSFWSPRPGDYDVIMQPEFLVHENWGAGVPPFTVDTPSQEDIMGEW